MLNYSSNVCKGLISSWCSYRDSGGGDNWWRLHLAGAVVEQEAEVRTDSMAVL